MRGSSWRSIAFLMWSLSIGTVAGVNFTPSNITQYQSAASSSPIDIQLPDSSSSMKRFAFVQPLFSTAVVDLRPTGLSDNLFAVTTSNYLNLTSHRIAYMSCDPGDYDGGQIPASDLFDTALAVNVTAILLYSTTADSCNLTSEGSSYPFIYSMTNTTAAAELLHRINSASTEYPLLGLITYADTNASSSGSNTASGSSSDNGIGASPTTAVAMIILYSITGIITGLFLVIIVTGAVRAHRHPERYGPRNMIGRARQSRAKGLARAMLDTIPIVKFGEREPPKPTDTELAENGHAPAEDIQEIGLEHTNVMAGRKSHDAMAEPRLSTASAPLSGIAPATTATESDPAAEATIDDAPGCSICTEDFEIGQDLRVLPCDHKFHPACIDPWLLNVSGTCPLCRINLNPQAAPESAGGENTELPPPIDAGEPGPRPRIGMRQSFLIGLGLGRVHDQTREERLAAVRQLRIQQAQTRATEAAEERARRRRFREFFGIRTRRSGQAGETTEEPADLEAGLASAPEPHA
ncbi:hypothetical protein BDV97DRAFT_397419 [Delphinella strobiligena]|nr:hypothetical protein BDV97DRAFT_397419 [Delphinella strobiligena]